VSDDLPRYDAEIISGAILTVWLALRPLPTDMRRALTYEFAITRINPVAVFDPEPVPCDDDEDEEIETD
jgi:hypothetical protein